MEHKIIMIKESDDWSILKCQVCAWEYRISRRGDEIKREMVDPGDLNAYHIVISSGNNGGDDDPIVGPLPGSFRDWGQSESEL